jgi:Fibronectin type III domain
MTQRAAQRIGWLCALPLIASCSGQTGSSPAPAGAAGTRGTLTVSWRAPIRNADGTPATDLTGYTLYYGPGPGAYNARMSIDNPSATQAVIHGLQPGVDYYFVVAARNAAGRQSVLSPEVHGKARAE